MKKNFAKSIFYPPDPLSERKEIFTERFRDASLVYVDKIENISSGQAGDDRPPVSALRGSTLPVSFFPFFFFFLLPHLPFPGPRLRGSCKSRNPMRVTLWSPPRPLFVLVYWIPRHLSLQSPSLLLPFFSPFSSTSSFSSSSPSSCGDLDVAQGRR